MLPQEETYQPSILWQLKRGSRNPPLFLIHGWDGSVAPYFPLVCRMSADRSYYGFNTVGRDKQRNVYAGLEEMAAHYVELVRSVQPAGPYYLGGYCTGGTLAFEMAQQLYARGDRVALLTLFDTFGPTYPRITKRVLGHLYTLSRLERAQRQRYLKEKGRVAVGRMKELFMHARDSCVGVARDTSPRLERFEGDGFILLNPTYHARPYPGRLLLFRADEQRSGFNPDPFSGWGGTAHMGLEVHNIPGDHATMMAEPYVGLLAEKLSSVLKRVQTEEPHRRAAPEIVQA